ncbi:FAD-binding oxidoreductase [uncultured Roseobacter sp.]|uniref:NAD(P)/FAD-dependent oxidoreductase n=1 Tax=uncultured Roseobacter sp. TaxID=114847 RepID=UPI00261D3511|nr:FAD-binding oxidoreductase [uncultured Roseobacter sp.]
MTRIFGDYAYGSGPRAGCWWDETCAAPERPSLRGTRKVDVAIIGAGFTGLSAALHLAEAGLSVMVLDAAYPGWGASGRNGGFCCLGGGMLGDAELDARFGRSERLAFRATEKAAVECVSDLIGRLKLSVDRHSHGETELAHRPRHMAALREKAIAVEENYGVSPQLIEAEALATHGFAGPFFGALTIPVGFALNPRKYLLGLAAAAEAAGAMIFHSSRVRGCDFAEGRHRLSIAAGEVIARQVIVATNGYSSEDLPASLAGRYMPAQSNVLVTRPLTEAEISAQGWHTDQMCYDSRHLLHYFRLMPDRRFLFGMRGGLFTGARAERRARSRIRRDFRTLFPEWADVAVDHIWSGMVSLARHRLPFVGALDEGIGLWAAISYHGNGIAMGSLAGKLLADRICGHTPDAIPLAMRQHPPQFPFGRARRLVMPAAYAGFLLADL